MEIQFQHHHVLTFCDQNKKNFSHILFKFFKRDERNRRKVDGDVEVAELDNEECAELDDEEEHAELDDEEGYEELDDEEDYPRCLVCLRIIDDGPVYFCEMCDGIWVHKFCAYLPREIRAHPLHLQQDHSLTLQTRYNYPFNFNNFEKYICQGCRDIIIIYNYYECSECGLKLDLKCALPPDNADPQQITASLSPDTKTQISHDSHRHTLFLVNFRSIKKWTSSSYICILCEREIADLTYCCFSCPFYLHKRCVEITQQECEVQHPCQSHHSISIEYGCEKFICDQCRNLCSGFFMAICKECGFKIDFKCAFIKDITFQRSTGDEVKAQIRYFNHDLHLLSFFNYSDDINDKCEGCGLPLSGPSYGCLECSVYLHKSCVELTPIIKHPYHPFHNLHRQALAEEQCRACQRLPRGLSYRCSWCPSFCLDTQCVINNLGVISALKNKDYHKHDLYYFVAADSLIFRCKICSQICEGSFYICLECEHRPYFHMECIGIPKEMKHDCHIHPLTLVDPLTEDEIDESKDQYYCYTCENKRNPRYHSYSCQLCASTGHIFTAHIECVLSTELNEIEQKYIAKEGDEEDDKLEKVPQLCNHSISPRCMKQLLMKDQFNDHILNYFEDITRFFCYLCKELEKGPRYECSFCQIHLHKECAKLPSKIKHNLHEHPLFIRGGEFMKEFICDGCQVFHIRGMCYYCEECSFFLDRMCAQGIPSTGNYYRKLNDNGSKVGFSHFSHDHKLRFAFILEKLKVYCSTCPLLISGPTYCCYACNFFLHESCFNELKPQYIQHPFHIQHPLHFTDIGVICKACRNYWGIGYNCAEGDFELDVKCAKYLTSGLQHKCHEHKLFCFMIEDINNRFRFRCKTCQKDCNASFYRCFECDLSLHIECIPIPKNVKSVCHVHPLSLMDLIIEEGQDEYYCHACESLRNPKHAAYYCKKCYFTAHIGCVLDEEDGELEIL